MFFRTNIPNRGPQCVDRSKSEVHSTTPESEPIFEQRTQRRQSPTGSESPLFEGKAYRQREFDR